jgi:hypothetical protein
MTISELIPTIAALSHADKFQLVQIVLQQLAEEDGVEIQQPTPFDPRQFFGVNPHAQPTIMGKTSLRGTLKHYANPTLMVREQTAWLDTVENPDERH